uniref:Inner centromere protein ARK-binding domain-containing protein n=1 Tax=Ditylenchus dipsaci TaxID=166011 RepID=A0A915DB15_9BILA
MKEEDLKLIASIGDWSDVNKIMMQIYYEQFGKLLEQKLDKVQQGKLPIKECIKQLYGSSKVPVTPKRLNPTKKLLEQIHQIKTLCFESDDDEEKEKKPVKSSGIPDRIFLEQSAEESLVESRISAELEDVSIPVPQAPKKKKSALHKPKEPMEALAHTVKDIRPAPEVFKTAVIRAKSAVKKTIQAPSSTPSQVEKTEQAHKQREELLKEKAERTKRELEERRQRVEQNHRRLEQEKQERDDAIRAKTNSPFTPTASRAALPKFVPLPFFHASPSLLLYPRIFVQLLTVQLNQVKNSNKSLDVTEEVINDSQQSSQIDQQTAEMSGLDATDASNIPQNAVRQPEKNVPSVPTNYDVDDLGSNDETDDDENPRKVIPLWARPDALKKHVLSVKRMVGHSRSECHFGQIESLSCEFSSLAMCREAACEEEQSVSYVGISFVRSKSWPKSFSAIQSAPSEDRQLLDRTSCFV